VAGRKAAKVFYSKEGIRHLLLAALNGTTSILIDAWVLRKFLTMPD
jgi:hypothetical protein